jgi:glycosyltransferase involved in cell wall biosynthesis
MSQKLKIISVLGHFFPVLGGKETAVYNLSLELKRIGHDVQIFTSDRDRSGARIRNAPQSYAGIKIRRIFGWFMLGPTAVFFPGIMWQLLWTKFDVIIVNTYRQPHTDLALLVAKLKRRVCILATHFPMMERSGRNKLLANFYDKRVAPLFLPRYDAVICLSGQMREFLLSQGVKAKNISIIPNGVENEYFAERIERAPSKKTTLINVATYTHIKGQDLLIAALPFVKKPLDVLFVGPREDMTHKLEQLIGNDKSIQLLGPKNKEELVKLYSEADIFVLPSRYEPFGIVVLEAMAMGLPVVVTKHGGTTEFVKEPFGKIADPFNPRQFAKAINFFIDNPYRGNEGKMVAKMHSWESLAKDTEQLIRKTMRKK